MPCSTRFRIFSSLAATVLCTTVSLTVPLRATDFPHFDQMPNHWPFGLMFCSYVAILAKDVSYGLYLGPNTEGASPMGNLIDPRPSRSENATSKAARILIAEDRKSMRRALGVLFELHKNWQVCGEAEDANEAIRKAEELHPDLIVLDYKMPCSDGLQAANGILRVLPDVPMVMFTLYKTDELERAANSIGIRRVVGKEQGVQALFQAMEQLLPRV
jgi:CheY-like chemotaxis protein